MSRRYSSNSILSLLKEKLNLPEAGRFERITMERQNPRAIILAVGITIMLIGGCGSQEQNQDMSKSEMIKRERLMTAENKRLAKELEKQKELLAKNIEDKKTSEEQLQKSLRTMREENSKLSQTIKELKIQAGHLEGEFEQIKWSKETELRAAAEENSKLSQTNERLEIQVRQLKEEVKYLTDSKGLKKQEEEIQRSLEEMSENAVKDLEKIGKLQEENENLKTEITELKKGLETHKSPTP